MASRIAPLVVSLVIVLLAMLPVAASAADDARPTDVVLTADLDGRPIPLVSVSKFYCNDFDYPAIHCFSSPAALGASLDAMLSTAAASGLDYVQWWDQSNYGGASMIASQDYGALSFIGWNDRIGSFKGKNLQTGNFYTDWFMGGTAYYFCCNQLVPSLGGFNDTFSSVYNN